MHRLTLKWYRTLWAVWDFQKQIETILDKLNMQNPRLLEYGSPNHVRPAVVQLSVEQLPGSMEEYLVAFSKQIRQATDHAAPLVCFPMHTGFWPLSFLPGGKKIAADLFSLQENAAGKRPDEYLDEAFRERLEIIWEPLWQIFYHTFSNFSRRLGIYIAAGSFCCPESDGIYQRNYLFGPDGEVELSQDLLYPDKIQARLGFVGGEQIRLAQTKTGDFSLLFLQDAIRPECVKIAKSLGAKLIVSCAGTDGLLDAQTYLAARLSEFGLYAAVSDLTGGMKRNKEAAFLGRSGIFGPYQVQKNDQPLISDATNEAAVLTARLNWERLGAYTNNYNADRNEEFYRRVYVADPTHSE